MMSRRAYMDGHVTHDEYYGHIVREARIVITDYALIARCRLAFAAGDQHLNNTAVTGLTLSTPAWVKRKSTRPYSWDDVAAPLQFAARRVLRACGDSWSLAGGVCIAKEAIRQAIHGRGIL